MYFRHESQQFDAAAGIATVYLFFFVFSQRLLLLVIVAHLSVPLEEPESSCNDQQPH